MPEGSSCCLQAAGNQVVGTPMTKWEIAKESMSQAHHRRRMMHDHRQHAQQASIIAM